MVLLDVCVYDKEYRFLKWYKEEEALKLLRQIYYTYPHHPLLVLHVHFSSTPTTYEIDINKAFNAQFKQFKYAEIWNLVPIKYKPKWKK